MTTKTVAQVLVDLTRKVTNTWATTLIAERKAPVISGGGVAVEDTTERLDWPLRLPVGKPDKTDLANQWPQVQRWASEWRDWANTNHLPLGWENRLTAGIRQTLPTHLTIPDIDTAVTVLADGWPARLATARYRLGDLCAEFPHAATPATLTAITRLDDTDFALLLVAARWFAHHDATGLTPRQVPVEGLHGKWLNTHHRLIETLTNKPHLGLTDRSTRVHFTYLDPTHQEAGGRRHDSHTLGDTTRPVYQPRIIVIAENKDTAVLFPALPNTISIEGNGYAGPALIPQLDWVHRAERIIYWGDIDAAGYEIVHRYRAAGLPIETILMDPDTYESYERWGTHTDDKNNPIVCAPAKPLDRLADPERIVYDSITDPGWTRVRRIEQERIPLDVARRLLMEQDAHIDR